jgi:hypothetical protein
MDDFKVFKSNTPPEDETTTSAPEIAVNEDKTTNSTIRIEKVPNKIIKDLASSWPTFATSVKINIDKVFEYLLASCNKIFTDKMIKNDSYSELGDNYHSAEVFYCTLYDLKVGKGSNTSIAKRLGREEEMFIIGMVLDLLGKYYDYDAANANANKRLECNELLINVCNVACRLDDLYRYITNLGASFELRDATDCARDITSIYELVSQFYYDIGLDLPDATLVIDICYNITWNKKLAACIEAYL